MNALLTLGFERQEYDVEGEEGIYGGERREQGADRKFTV